MPLHLGNEDSILYFSGISVFALKLNTKIKIITGSKDYTDKQSFPSFNCKLIENPHGQKDLKALNGMNQKVIDFVSLSPGFPYYFEK